MRKMSIPAMRNKQRAAMPALFLFSISTLIFASCSTAPLKRVTQADLDRTNIYKYFECYNKPVEILKYLNRDGDVTFECYTRDRKKKLYYIRLMAAPEGLSVRTIPVEEQE